MQQQIKAYYQATFADKQNIQVSDPRRIADGWETEIFSFEIDYFLNGEPIHENIIMRIFPSNDAHEKSTKEFSVMRQLYAVGYPVPQVYHLEQENSPWGKPFILMERIEGGIMWPQLVGSNAEKQEILLTQFCDLFVQLHQLDWRSFADDVSRYDLKNRYQFIDNTLNQGAGMLESFGLTGFLPVVEWMQQRRETVPCDQPALIHFDFHPANVMLRPDETAVVLDWSWFDISDARFDLAWTLVLVSSFEGSSWRDRILQTYEQVNGAPVKQIEYFEVYACMRRLFSIVASITGGAEKMGLDPNAVESMKGQMFSHHWVYDLLIERTGIHIPEVEEMFATIS